MVPTTKYEMCTNRVSETHFRGPLYYTNGKRTYSFTLTLTIIRCVLEIPIHGNLLRSIVFQFVKRGEIVKNLVSVTSTGNT